MKCNKCDKPNLFTCYMMHDNTLPKECKARVRNLIGIYHESLGYKHG